MRIVEKDILSVTKTGVICHQVNCKRVMGAGLALNIRTKWPHVYNVYRSKQDWELGDCQIVTINATKLLYVANLAGQYNCGRSGSFTHYDALRVALRTARDFSDANGLTLYIPYMMGCGLAGGDWSKVYKIIETIAPKAVICKNTLDKK